MISYQLAYLKANYPLYFMAGLLTSAIGNEAKIAQYIMEAKQRDITILPPSINYSGYSFHAEEGGIRYSLAAIKSVGAVALREVFQARKTKKFDDLFDFCIRISSKAINRKTLEVFVHSGSFDEFGEDRATLLASLDVALEHAGLFKPDDSNQFALFSDEEMQLKPKYVQVDPIRQEDKLAFEKDALGFYLSDHPVSIYEKRLKKAGAKLLFDLVKDQKRVVSGVYITSIKTIRTKKGDSMAFLNVSDSSGDMEAVVFPMVFKRFSQFLHQGEFAVIEGKLEEREEKLQFIIQHVSEIESWLTEKTKEQSTLYLKIVEDKQDETSLKQLKDYFKGRNGKTRVVLHYEKSRKTIRLGNEFNIDPSQRLLGLLQDFLGVDNVVLKQ
jgi:DNA polymerase-3 subunit alpha